LQVSSTDVHVRSVLRAVPCTFKVSFWLGGSEVVIVEEVSEDSQQNWNSHYLLDERVQLFHARHVDLTAHHNRTVY